MADDFIKDTCERVKDHASRKAPLAIRGGGTKAFLGAPPAGEPLEVDALRLEGDAELLEQAMHDQRAGAGGVMQGVHRFRSRRGVRD